jgi:hypothetical protein
VRAGEAFLATVKNDPDFQRWWHSDERRQKWQAFAAEAKRRVDEGHQTWQHFVGEKMPTELEEIRLAALRFGLSPDAVLRGDFTLADVTTLMIGKQLAAADDLLASTRAAAAEAAVRQAAACNAAPDARHSADFSHVYWFGQEYKFAIGLQAGAVRALWAEWEKTGLGLHQETIREEIDAERDNFRMAHVFRNHPALGRMIDKDGEGRYRLKSPR